MKGGHVLSLTPTDKSKILPLVILRIGQNTTLSIHSVPNTHYSEYVCLCVPNTQYSEYVCLRSWWCKGHMQTKVIQSNIQIFQNTIFDSSKIFQ